VVGNRKTDRQGVGDEKYRGAGRQGGRMAMKENDRCGNAARRQGGRMAGWWQIGRVAGWQDKKKGREKRGGEARHGGKAAEQSHFLQCAQHFTGFCQECFRRSRIFGD